MDPEKARKAAAEQMKKLKAETRAFSTNLATLQKCAGEHADKVANLQSAIDRIKPPPDKKATLGSNPDIAKLLKASRLAEASARYETARKDVQTGLSKSGQQRMMLNTLISMTNICVEQHTGGKAGQAFENRRDTRLIHTALKGLKASDAHHQKAEKSVSDLPQMTRQQWEDRRIGDLKQHAQEAKAASKAADALQSTYDAFQSTFDAATADAAKGFAMADQEDKSA